MWQKVLTSWWRGSREREMDLGPGRTFKDMSPVIYLLQLDPSPNGHSYSNHTGIVLLADITL
jgi:hypothetical protein